MPVLKIKKDGVWEEVGGSSSMGGGNADTLDGKHADEFVSNDNVLLVTFDRYNYICSHSAPEIVQALNYGKTIICPSGISVGSYRTDGTEVDFVDTFILYDMVITMTLTVNEDKSFTEKYDWQYMTRIVEVSNNVAEYSSYEIYNFDNIVKLRYNGCLYDFQFISNDIAYFICNQSDNNTKYMSVVTVDNDKNVSEAYSWEAIVPVPNATDTGKVLVAGNNKLSWENASGKTLTQHLTEEDMVLSSRQYGDTLPPAGNPGRIFFLKVVKE